MTDLQSVVEEIGALADAAEASRWEVCHAVADAYAELGPYERGLTAGLVVRLKRESDTIYNYRDAWRLWEELRVRYVLEIPAIGLPYSHYAAMYDLRERYDLTLEECHDWLEIATANSLSVRVMRQEVETAHRESEQKAFQRHVRKLERTMLVLYQDAESMGLPEQLWWDTRELSRRVKTWGRRFRRG